MSHIFNRLLSTVHFQRFDGETQSPPEEFSKDCFACFNTSSQSITFPLAQSGDDDDDGGGSYDWIELDHNGVAGASLSRNQRVVELRIVDKFDPEKVCWRCALSTLST